jgi:hypothetical protein
MHCKQRGKCSNLTSFCCERKFESPSAGSDHLLTGNYGNKIRELSKNFVKFIDFCYGLDVANTSVVLLCTFLPVDGVSTWYNFPLLRIASKNRQVYTKRQQRPHTQLPVLRWNRTSFFPIIFWTRSLHVLYWNNSLHEAPYIVSPSGHWCSDDFVRY